MNPILRTIFVIAVLLLSACQIVPSESKFFLEGKDTNELLSELESRPIDEAYRAYIYAMEAFHPPHVEMVRALTDRGAQGIPFLIDKLEEERDESIILHIIYAFECYMSFGKYNVKDDQRAIDTIEMAIRRVRTSHVKTNAMEMLQDIKK